MEENKTSTVIDGELTFDKLKQMSVEDLDKLGRKYLRKGKAELWTSFVATCDTPYEINILSAIVLQMSKLNDGDSFRDIITSLPKSLGIDALEKISKGVALFCPNGVKLKMVIDQHIADRKMERATMWHKAGQLPDKEYYDMVDKYNKMVSSRQKFLKPSHIGKVEKLVEKTTDEEISMENNNI